MCVLIEGINVVVRRAVIERVYPGGVLKLQQDCPNRTFCADDTLIRVGFMSPYDVQRWVTHLEQSGLTWLHDRQCVDVAVVDQVYGPTTQCDWLEFGRQPEGYLVSWLKGTVPREIAVPDGWEMDTSLSRNFKFVPSSDVTTTMEYKGRSGNLDELVDRETGMKYYIGRPNWKD